MLNSIMDNPFKWVSGVLVSILLMGSVYTVEEGNVNIIKRFGKAIDYVSPGLHFKVPIVDSTKPMDVRTRKYAVTMQASTTGKVGGKDAGKVELQMPSTIKMSANWSIPEAEALSIYKVFGGLEQYEDKILDPRVLKATKSVFAKHSIEYIVSNRELVTDEIIAEITITLAGYNAKLSDINIESPNYNRNILEDECQFSAR